jgi:hypothetical protein
MAQESSDDGLFPMTDEWERVNGPFIDEKGRTNPRAMEDRQLLEEILRNQRQANDTIEAFIENMAKNPMFKMFAGKFGM